MSPSSVALPRREIQRVSPYDRGTGVVGGRVERGGQALRRPEGARHAAATGDLKIEIAGPVRGEIEFETISRKADARLPARHHIERAVNRSSARCRTG